MSIQTAVCDVLGIEHPIILAPMAGVSGGKLASAVSRAGGLGMIGGGYGDAAWLQQEFAAAGNERVGVGFITWSIARKPHLLKAALDRSPAALMLSFGSLEPVLEYISGASAKLIVQVQTLAQAREALAAGADIIVAQGTEAGGHGAGRATFPLVPAIVDMAGSTPVVAAGGVGDGRGLAAALSLGASGVLCGTAFFAADEALAHDNAKDAVVASDGDNTERSSLVDVVRGLEWPPEWNIRTLSNAFTKSWRGNLSELSKHLPSEMAAYAAAQKRGDMDIAAAIAGEASGLIHRRETAQAIVFRMVDEAKCALDRAMGTITR